MKVHASQHAIAVMLIALLEGQMHATPLAQLHATKTAMTRSNLGTSLAIQQSSKAARTSAKQAARVETKYGLNELLAYYGYVFSSNLFVLLLLNLPSVLSFVGVVKH